MSDDDTAAREALLTELIWCCEDAGASKDYAQELFNRIWLAASRSLPAAAGPSDTAVRKALQAWWSEEGCEDPRAAYLAGWLAASRSIPAAAALLREAGWRVEEPKCETCGGWGYAPDVIALPTLEPPCPTCNGTGARKSEGG